MADPRLPPLQARHRVRSDQVGQGLTEYILLLAIVMILASIVKNALSRIQIADSLLAPITKEFRYVYQYGHSEARGLDEGGPKKHPRAVEGEGSFRLFLNPGKP